MVDIYTFKKSMGTLNERLTGEENLLKSKNILTPDFNNGEGLMPLIEKSSETSFRLLIMGRFSSGKSAFINVLLGEKLLPEKALPTTALITEIYYSDEKKIVIYPKKDGEWQGGTAPFEIPPTIDEIKRYCTIDNTNGLNVKEGDKVNSMFEKMVVYWPLEILKGGISIVDSPGIDDPYQNDYIVQEYIPQSDAVLYCIPGTMPFSAKDVEALMSIKDLGFTKPVIVTTYFDVVTANMTDSEKEEYMDQTFNFYSEHTTREYCHYVNSLLGLAAKKSGSEDDLKESGYYDLESFLGKYLTEERGKVKLKNIIEAVNIFNKKMIDDANIMIDNLDISDQEFEERVNKAKDNLKNAKQSGELVKKEFQIEIDQIKNDSENLAVELYDELYEKSGIADYKPATSYSLIHPIKTKRAIADECLNKIKLEQKFAVSAWNKEKFEPAVDKAIKQVIARMEEQFGKFSGDIEKANKSLRLDGNLITKNTNVGMFEKMMTEAWSNVRLNASLYGGAAIRGGAAYMAVCALVAAGLLPMSEMVAIGAFAAAIVMGPAWGIMKLTDAIKKQVASDYRKSMKKNKASIVKSLKDSYEKVFDEFTAVLESSINEDIKAVEDIITNTQKERELNAEKVEQRKAEIKEVIEYIKETDSINESLLKEYAI